MIITVTGSDFMAKHRQALSPIHHSAAMAPLTTESQLEQEV